MKTEPSTPDPTAFSRSLAIMDPLVSLELTGSEEVLAALSTVKGPLARVDALMAFQSLQA